MFKMRFVKQTLEIPVRNNDNHTCADGSTPKRHSELLPNNVRCIIAGPSGCGKTNVLLSLIESENGLKFENVYIYCKTLDQDKYKYLAEILSAIKDIGFYAFSSSQNVLSTSQMKKNSLVVFDDVINDSSINRDIVRNIFTLGRHRCIDVVYLVQSYTKLNKHLIRDNCNFIILFRQDDTNLKHVYNDMGVNADMKFEDICLEHFVWNIWFDFEHFVWNVGANHTGSLVFLASIVESRVAIARTLSNIFKYETSIMYKS